MEENLSHIHKKDPEQNPKQAHQETRKGDRSWEDNYRNRWAHDKVVRSTHGVNCTGSCSWNIYVKNGIVTWENQAHDYPETEENMPEFEPRGCPRGATFSWYLYSPLRIKYPYIRAELAELWRKARKQYPTAYEAWKSIASDPEKTKRYKQVRGLGGMVRSTWDEVSEIVACSELYTAYTYGPDRNFGFSPIPAMSQISYAAGARFNQLMGGAQLSFYDWYADLPPASPQIWGDQTDVPESSDWYNAAYLMMWGSNVPQTRTPDAHFMTEVRYKGTKVVAVAPDYAESVEFADTWIAPNVGTDSALAMAMGHVILNEYYWKKPEPFFLNYAKQFTDMPFVIFLDKRGENYEPGRFVNASDMGEAGENPKFNYYVFDANSKRYVIPNGTMGDRWGDCSKWNLKLEDARSGNPIDPTLSFIDAHDSVVDVAFPYFGSDAEEVFTCKVPVRKLTLANGEEALIATVHDVLLSQYGVDRGLGDGAKGYDDASRVFTPAWQQAITNVDPELVIKTAREFADNSIASEGRSMIIMGAGINHWYHADNIYRSVLNLVLFCATEGRNGGGWAHYVGQEKLRPAEGWATIMTAGDWQKPPRLQNATSFYYFSTDQWRSDEIDTKDLASPLREPRYRNSGDYNILAARLGWLPAYPTFNRSGARIIADAREQGAQDEAGINNYLIDELKNKRIDFAYADPDAPENFPRNLIVWRANLLGSSAKGNEYFFKYLLGAKSCVFEPEFRAAEPEEITVRDEYLDGKLDLLVTLDFRMATTALYSDIVLPTATWYEKTDISTTDMHPFVHPFSPAVEPGWESKTDWDIFRTLAEAVSKVAKEANLQPLEDIVAVPLHHDSPAEIAQPDGKVLDWSRDECEAIPGKTMPQLVHVVRDYTKTYDKWIALGPNVRDHGMASKGFSWDAKEEYELITQRNGTIQDKDLISYGLPSIYHAEQAIDAVLLNSSTSNGNVAVKSFKALEKKCGLDNLSALAEGKKDVKITYKDTQIRPQQVITTPIFTGSNTNRRFTPFTMSIEEKLPFRTITGRQSFYLDHELMAEWGEHLATYKPILDYQPLRMPHDPKGKAEIILKYLTPHNKWSTHSMYFDTQQLLTLFRGGQTVLMNEQDAAAIACEDNDWIELFNRNGVVAARIATTSRIPRGSVFMYHAQDRHINVPFTQLTKTRGSSHNGPTHIHVKPTHMIGAYGQLSYGFNYYGTTGNQRDMLVVVRKMEEVDWRED
ncbi:MAG: nitrate reductase subunit alpha [Coriobacteriia bacterium]|nr:nitrate reductase subunit alpha [Coriobacteriia bacterium]